jgi:O-antigen ligase
MTAPGAPAAPAARVIGVGLVLIVLVFLPTLANPFQVPKESLVAWVAGFVLLLVALNGTTPAEPWPRRWWAALLALPALATVSAAIHGADPLASHGALRWWTYAALAAAVYLACGPAERGRLLRLVAVVGAVEGAIVVAGVLLGPRVFDVTQLPASKWRAFGTLGNPNWVGAFLAAVLPLNLAALADAPSGRARRSQSILTAGTLTGLVLTVSRGAWVAALGGVLVLVALRPDRAWRRVVPVCAATVAAAAALMLWQLGGESLANRASVSGRGRMWEVTAAMIAARPLDGWGPGGFAGAYPPFQRAWVQNGGDRSITDLTDHPHNHYLQLAAELGLAGVLVAAACAAVLARAVVAGATRREAAPLVASLAAIAVHALGDAPLAQPATTALACVLLVLLLGLAAPAAAAAPRPLGGGARAMLAVVALLAVAQGMRLLVVDRGLTHARRALAAGDPQSAIAAAEAALRLEPAHGELWTALAFARRAAGNPAGAAGAAAHARALRPDPILWYALAEIGIEAGDRERAIAELRELNETLPGLLRPRVLLGEAYAGAGRAADARSVLAPVLALRSKVPNPDERLLQARAARALEALPAQ